MCSSDLEIRIRNLHPGMSRFHVAALVLAGPSSCHTDLIDPIRFEFGNICGGEPAVDAAIACHVRHKLVDDRRNRLFASETIIQRLLAVVPVSCLSQHSQPRAISLLER